MMVAFDKVMNLDYTMTVSLYLFKNVIGLDFCQNLDHCLFEAGSCHQFLIIRSCKPFFSYLNFLDRLHSIANLIVHLIYKVAYAVALNLRLIR
jgi:hypothetical protein